MSVSKLHRNLKIRLVEQFFSGLVGNMIFPFMVVFFAERMGQSQAGLLLMLNAGIGIVVGLYGGYLADRFGRRWIMLRAEIVRVICYLFITLIMFSSYEMTYLIFVLFAISGLVSNLSYPAANAMIIDSSTREDRKLIFTISYWLNQSSVLVGTFLGALFFKSYRVELMGVVTVMSFISLLLLLFWIQESLEPQKAAEPTQRKSVLSELLVNYRDVMRDAIFKVFFIACLLDLSLETQTQNYLAVKLTKEFDIQTLISALGIHVELDGYKMYSLLYMVNTFTVLLVGLFIGKLTKSFKDINVLKVGLIFFSVGVASLCFFTNAWTLLLLMFVASLGELMYVPVKQTLLANIVPDDRRGAYMAVYNLSFRGSSLFGTVAVTLGAILPSWGISVMFAAIGFLSLGMFLSVDSKSKAREASNQFATETSSSA